MKLLWAVVNAGENPSDAPELLTADDNRSVDDALSVLTADSLELSVNLQLFPITIKPNSLIH